MPVSDMGPGGSAGDVRPAQHVSWGTPCSLKSVPEEDIKGGPGSGESLAGPGAGDAPPVAAAC